MIIDYSDWRPKAQADLGGVNGVVRYLSHDTARATGHAEMAQLHEWDIATALVYEDQAQRAIDPANAAGDARMCGQAMRALGVPAGRPVYVALDWDIADYAPGGSNPLAKLGPVGDYLAAFRKVLTGDYAYQTGVYGGYWAVSRAITAGLTSWGWQTVAWSPLKAPIPQQDPRIPLYPTGA